jgi:catechol 2,3-dioxygenase
MRKKGLPILTAFPGSCATGYQRLGVPRAIKVTLDNPDALLYLFCNLFCYKLEKPVAATEKGPIAAGTRIGHVHLKVANIDRALQFYCGVLGFELIQKMGNQAAFISAGGYHHHIGLNTWESAGGSPPPPGTTGLYHLAILYPTRADLADALKRLAANGITLDGASDHGVSEALYLRDPDENGVELYVDRPEEQWPRNADGSLAMVTRRLDLEDLLRSAQS